MALGKPVSDHCPCVVTIETKIPKSKIFRFENYWINHSGFLDVVANSWNSPSHATNSAALMCRKFKKLRYGLKTWSKGVFRLSILIQNCKEALVGLDGLEDLRPLSTPEKNFRRIVTNDYRPITLLNCCLKIITKLLANRLQKLILKIVHRNQYGFLRDRTIQDCLAWAFEYIFQCQNSGKEIVLLKLDFAKAFDTIEHSAMLEIMKNMGFDARWLGWIECIFNSGTSSVLLNGVPGRQFICRRGVRQGDPLSPLIFVLAADLLQSAINEAHRTNEDHQITQ